MSHHHFVRELVYGGKAIFFSKELLLLIYDKTWIKILSLPLFSGQVQVDISAKEHIFDKSAT